MADVTAAAAVDTGWFAGEVDQLARNVERVVRGKHDVIRRAITCLLAEGHLLVDDVPGVGKTTLARALARSIDASWKRIQFTPDLLPSDVTGVSVWDESARSFTFHPGPVFANVVVADEVNRASPKTQSALLEVMEERTVTVDAVSHAVPEPFLVVATQNPIEYEGTYRLPEAQRDRFLMRIEVGYPDAGAESDIVDFARQRDTVDDLEPVTTLATVEQLIQAALGIHIAPDLRAYIVQVVGATRAWPDIRLGVSPRGTQALVRATLAQAAGEGRSYAVPQDVKDLAVPVLAHRLILTPDAELEGRTPGDVLAAVLDSVPVPQVLSGS